MVRQAQLEKHIKELNVRMVDFETKSYGTPPRPSSNTRRLESRIEELTNQLSQVNKDKGDSSRIQRSADTAARDTKFQLAESDRQRARLEEERKAYEEQVQSLRQAMDVMVRFPCAFQAVLADDCLDSKPKKAIFSLRNVEQNVRQRT
jgi:myosin protein heavy chain